NFASQTWTALASIAWKTGSSWVGELLMTCSTSDVARCCSRASASSRVRASSCFFNSISELGPLLTRALAFVPVERSLRPRVGLFAPLRDKVTSSAQSLVPPSGRRLPNPSENIADDLPFSVRDGRQMSVSDQDLGRSDCALFVVKGEGSPDADVPRADDWLR